MFNAVIPASISLPRTAAGALKPLLFAFVFVCIFDPADRLIGGKVWLFVALCCATLYDSVGSRRRTLIPVNLVVYIVVFVSIPLLALINYFITSGIAPFAGFALFKSYFLISLALVLVLNRIDCVPVLSAALGLMAGITIGIFVILQMFPEMFLPLHDLGEKYGIISISERVYGRGVTINQITFATAPMLAIAIPHYFDRAISAPTGSSRSVHVAMLIICVAGMFMAGLRNTMAVAVLLPFVLWPLYTRRVIRNGLLSIAAVAILSLSLISRLQVLLDPSEFSNGIKLKFLRDYAAIFSDPITLLFGQGLGAYYRWSSSGLPDFANTGANFYFITELTYPEMIRSFGLIGAAAMMTLLLYPVWWAFVVNSDQRQKALAIGYLAYLGMCAANPLLFSSLGMLILSSILANTFLSGSEHECKTARKLS